MPQTGHREPNLPVTLLVGLPGQVDDLAADADGWFLAPVAWDDLPVSALVVAGC